MELPYVSCDVDDSQAPEDPELFPSLFLVKALAALQQQEDDSFLCPGLACLAPQGLLEAAVAGSLAVGLEVPETHLAGSSHALHQKSEEAVLDGLRAVVVPTPQTAVAEVTVVLEAAVAGSLAVGLEAPETHLAGSSHALHQESEEAVSDGLRVVAVLTLQMTADSLALEAIVENVHLSPYPPLSLDQWCVRFSGCGLPRASMIPPGRANSLF